MDITDIILDALFSALQNTTTDDVPEISTKIYLLGRNRMYDSAVSVLEEKAKFLQARFEDEADTIHALNTKIAQLENQLQRQLESKIYEE